MSHLLKRMRERVRMMFEPRVRQPGDPKDPRESRIDATSKMNVDAPTTYVEPYEVHEFDGWAVTLWQGAKAPVGKPLLKTATI